MLKIEKINNFIQVTGSDNNFFPDNGKLSFPLNSLVLLLDKSDMATFKSADNGDVVFQGLIKEILIGGETVTKEDIMEKFEAVAYSSGGGGGGGSSEDTLVREKLKTQVGLDDRYNYTSPIEEGNTIADDINGILDSIDDSEEVIVEAFNKVRKTVGLSRTFDYESPIEEGNTIADDINALNDSNIPTAPYSSLKKIGKYLHRIKYDKVVDYDYALSNIHLLETPSNVPNDGACSVVIKDGKVGRNYDWIEPKDENYGSNTAEFIVETPATNNKHAVLGIASNVHITEDMAANHSLEGDAKTYFELLPYVLKDGINDAGLFCAVNVVPQDKGNNETILPWLDPFREMSTTMIVRYVLDNFSDAIEAIEYLRDRVQINLSQLVQSYGYDVHYIVGNKGGAYYVEFVDGTLTYGITDKLTNFHIDGVTFNEDGSVPTVGNGEYPSQAGITSYANGLERWNLLNVDDDVRNIMNSVIYSKTYDLHQDPFFYSEYTTRDYDVDIDTQPNDEDMQFVIDYAQQIKAGLKSGNLWNTNHSVVYDLDKKSAEIVSFEDYDNIIYLGGYDISEKIDRIMKKDEPIANAFEQLRKNLSLNNDFSVGDGTPVDLSLLGSVYTHTILYSTVNGNRLGGNTASGNGWKMIKQEQKRYGNKNYFIAYFVVSDVDCGVSLNSIGNFSNNVDYVVYPEGLTKLDVGYGFQCTRLSLPNTTLFIQMPQMSALTTLVLPPNLVYVNELLNSNSANVNKIVSKAMVAPMKEVGDFGNNLYGVADEGVLYVPAGSTGYDAWMDNLEAAGKNWVLKYFDDITN